MKRLNCHLKHRICTLDRFKIDESGATAFWRREIRYFLFEKVDQIIMPVRLVVVFFIKFYFSHER